MKGWKSYYKEYLRMGYPKDMAYRLARLDEKYNKKYRLRN